MQMLDFNALQTPTLPIKLRDEDQTVVEVTFPEVDLIDRLMAMVPELERVTETKDGATIRAVYGLMAELMNNNEDGLKFTAEELRDRYNVNLLHVFQFVAAYMEFIGEAQNAKN